MDELLEIRQLQAVVAVADAGGFSAAARRLHVVQSSVSSTVKQVERRLGTPLFERTTHRVRITPAGEAFVVAARAALRAVAEVRTAVELTSGELHGELTIGVMQGVWSGLHAALTGLRDAHPKVVLRLRQGPAGAMPQALRRHELDVAVVAVVGPDPVDLDVRPLIEEPMVAVVPPDVDAALPTGRVGLATLASHPFVDFVEGWAIRAEVDLAFARGTVARASSFEVNDVLVAAALIGAGLGVSVVPRTLSEHFHAAAVRELDDPSLRWRVCALSRPDDRSPLVGALLDRLG